MELTVQAAGRPSRPLGRWWAGIERWPWATSVLAATALLAHFWPAATQAWQWQRDLLTAEPWRLLTGHLTHWNGEHLLWDLLILLMAGAAVERLGRGRWLLSVAGSALLISAGIWLWQGEMRLYRGLSGLDSALVAAWCASLLSGGRAAGLAVAKGAARKRVLQRVAGLVLLLGLLGKSAYELMTGDAVFVTTESAGFVAVPLAHLIGGLWGGLSCLVFARR